MRIIIGVFVACFTLTACQSNSGAPGMTIGASRGPTAFSSSTGWVTPN